MSIIARKTHSNQSPLKGEIQGYFATPIDLYGSRIYGPAIAAARSQFPKVHFIEPALKDWNTAAWLEAWPEILLTINMLTVLPRIDRTVGRGCYKEVSEAHTAGISVWVFDHGQNRFIPYRKLIRLKFAHRSLPYYSRVYAMPGVRCSDGQ